MNIAKATNGKKTYTGVIILSLTPIISIALQNLGIADDSQILAGEIAGYIVGGVVTIGGLIHKWIKKRKKK